MIVIVFQAEFNDLSHAFHESVEFLGLGVTTAKGGNRALSVNKPLSSGAKALSASALNVGAEAPTS